MVAQNIGSASIIALDSFPVQKPDTGQGAPGESQIVNDAVALTTGGLSTTTSSYQMVRLPSTCKLKSLQLQTDTLLDTGGLAAALVIYVGAQYSDAPVSGNVGNANANGPILDGTPPSSAGTVISKEAFGTITNPAAFSRTEVIGNAGAQSWGSGAGNNQMIAKNQPLWQALGLASDPGGYIDVTLYIHTAANTAAAGNVDVQATFVM
jgi:hypothetical protein